MSHVEGIDREQITLFPEALDDYVSLENPVRFIDAFVATLDLVELGFTHAVPHELGRPPYNPADLLRLYIYGYLNRIRSSRHLEREANRAVELMWLLRRLAPDFPGHGLRQDHRRLPQGQRAGHSRCLPGVHRLLPPAPPLRRTGRRHRRVQVQGGQRPTPQLLRPQAQDPDRGDRRQHPGVPGRAREERPGGSRSPNAYRRRAQAEDRDPPGEEEKAASPGQADGPVRSDPGLPDRSR